MTIVSLSIQLNVKSAVVKRILYLNFCVTLKEGDAMNQFTFVENTFSFAPIQFLPIQEVFVKVTTSMVPGVKDYYWISNYGNLYSSFKNGLIQPGVDSKGYYYAALATDDGPKNMRIHRLVLLAFSYYSGCESEIINHCDGIKTNCKVWNLEWSDYSQNSLHAFAMGLSSRFHHSRTMSDEEVIAIANLLMENKLSCTEIASMFNTSDDMIYSIKFKRAYTNLTSSYNFPDGQIYSEDVIDRICKVMSFNKPAKPLHELNIRERHNYYQKIISEANIENSPRSVDLIKRIYRRTSFANISSKYIF